MCIFKGNEGQLINSIQCKYSGYPYWKKSKFVAHMMGEPEPAKRHPDGGEWAGSECWKKVDNGTREWPVWEPYGEGSDRGWCDSCTERQRLHEELAGVTRKRVGAWASLRAAVASGVRDG